MTTLTAIELRNIVDYDPVTGVFKWRTRDIPGSWNAKYAGKPAGSTMNTGYFKLAIGNKGHLAHRLAWLYVTGTAPCQAIDHINGDRTDNRFCNLRQATIAQNARNRGHQKNNRLGVKGVRRANGKYRADIKIGNKSVYLGVFPTVDEAHAAYREAAKTNFGGFSGY